MFCRRRVGHTERDGVVGIDDRLRGDEAQVVIFIGFEGKSRNGSFAAFRAVQLVALIGHGDVHIVPSDAQVDGDFTIGYHTKVFHRHSPYGVGQCQ